MKKTLLTKFPAKNSCLIIFFVEKVGGNKKITTFAAA